MAILFTYYTVTPAETANIPVGGTDWTQLTAFIKRDEQGNPIGRYTLNEYVTEVDTNRVIMYSNDGQYIYFGWNFSDLENHIPSLKELMAYYGYTLGGANFESVNPKDYWILNPDELEQWMAVTPHNQGEIV